MKFSASLPITSRALVATVVRRESRPFPKGWQKPYPAKVLQQLAGHLRGPGGFQLADCRCLRSRTAQDFARISGRVTRLRLGARLVFLHSISTARCVDPLFAIGNLPFVSVLGSKLTAWFVVGNLAHAKRIAAAESPIDALSYCSPVGYHGSALAVVSCAWGRALRADGPSIRPPLGLPSTLLSITTSLVSEGGERRGMRRWIRRALSSRPTARRVKIGMMISSHDTVPWRSQVQESVSNYE